MLSALAVLGVALLAGLWLGAPTPEPVPVEIAGPEVIAPEVADESITVHVAGAVRYPGLVHLRAGDRVAHAVAAAGGAVSTAELSQVNLAATVNDGDQVVVPSRGEAIAGPTGTAEPGLVDVNHGSAADLEALPGVGPVLAQRIYQYREEHGPFATVEDLLDVPGIGEGKLAALREALVLR
jgi:competence protein ComEA